jgi:threonine dehydrogenase-like Zn-dependent dehydrogenase
MERILFPAPNKVLMEEFSPAPLKKNEVQIKSIYSLVSNGTEKTALAGRFAVGSHWDQWVRYPFAPGYATVGTVIKVGDAHLTSLIGNRVAIRAPHASHHVVRQDDCIPIPLSVPLDQAVWFALARIGFLGAWAAQPLPGSVVLVVGGGPVAQMLTRWISALNVSVIAMLTRDLRRMVAGKEGGIHILLEGRTSDHCSSAIVKAIGRRPDVVIDCTDDASVLSWALSVVADYGRIVLLGDPGAPSERRLTADTLLRGISIVGTHDRCTYGQWTNRSVATEFFRMFSADKFKLDGLCSHQFHGRDALNAYNVLLNTPGLLGLRFQWCALGEE